MADPSAVPPALLAALESPPLERRGWLRSVAPNYIGLFFWVVYFDQLGRQALSSGGLGWSILGAMTAGLLCYQFLYYVPAMWGMRTGRPLIVVAASTFGATGSAWIAGVAIGLAQVVWFAAGASYATDLTLEGFIAFRLLDPRLLDPVSLDGITLMSPVFLVTSLPWCVVTAIAGRYLVRVIAALMSVLVVFPALMLGLAALMTVGGVGDFRPPGADPAAGPGDPGSLRAFALIIQMIFGFFATAGLMAADWGAVSRDSSDIRLGGWVGVTFASWIVATLALMTVAGALGGLKGLPALVRGPGLDAFTFRAALSRGIGGTPAGLMFLIFGLASLAPTVFAAHLFGQRFAAAWPGLSPTRWTFLGTAAAWALLIATGWASRLESIFSILGAVFAPTAGAMAADYVRARGAWPGPRRGVNPAGLVAWAVGMAVGLVPAIAEATGWDRGTQFQPAAVHGFMAGFLVYTILAKLGAESPVSPIPKPAEASAAGIGFPSWQGRPSAS
ncbi:MAG: hypothetical protein JO116_15090 [Planctomycetaceae bacterium]|nr:hypothetical protein [Planctomycetaceae bacterium]